MFCERRTVATTIEIIISIVVATFQKRTLVATTIEITPTIDVTTTIEMIVSILDK